MTNHHFDFDFCFDVIGDDIGSTIIGTTTAMVNDIGFASIIFQVYQKTFVNQYTSSRDLGGQKIPPPPVNYFLEIPRSAEG